MQDRVVRLRGLEGWILQVVIWLAFLEDFLSLFMLASNSRVSISFAHAVTKLQDPGSFLVLLRFSPRTKDFFCRSVDQLQLTAPSEHS